MSIIAELLLNFVFPFAFCDISYPWQIFFQDPATPMMEGIIKFHDALMFLIVFITLFVMTFLYDIQKNFNRIRLVEDPKVLISHNTVLEIVWTLIPTVLLAGVAFPSFYLLYSFEEFIDPTITVKITGYQWYWNYAVSDFENTLYKTMGNAVFLTVRGSNFDAYMVEHVQHLFIDNPWPVDAPSYKYMPGRFLFSYVRLLQTDKFLYLPVNTHIRLLVTAADVLHSWAVPSFGIKIDACPGRLSQVSLFIKRIGIFYGQCSEICGVNHGFMPISVQVVPTVQFCGGLYNFYTGTQYSKYEILGDISNISEGSKASFKINTPTEAQAHLIPRNLGVTTLGIVLPEYKNVYFDAQTSPNISGIRLGSDPIVMDKNSSIFKQ